MEFKRHNGEPLLRRKGKVFELVGGLTGAFKRENAQSFAQLLGGQLAEFEDQQEMNAVVESFPLIKSWPAHTGLTKINGKWQFLRSGKTPDYGKWSRMASKKEVRYAALCNKDWVAVDQVRLPLFLCQWEEKNFPKRNAQFDTEKKVPLEVTRFTHGTREFILIGSNIHWYGARRACELMGGRLAVLDSEELRRKAIEKLKTFSGNIFLGGYQKWGEWYFLNGKKFTFPLKTHPMILTPTKHNGFLSLQEGTFYSAMCSTAFLLERQKSSLSSSSR